MPVRVMVVENDININKVICDILEISFKDVKIDRAMDYESVVKKVRNADPRYDLILYDMDLDEPTGGEALAELLQESPDVSRHIIVLYDSPEEPAKCGVAKDLAYIIKPFSIDSFSEAVKKVSAN